jgi:hypothetical protein
VSISPALAAEDLDKPERTEIASVPPSSFPSEQPAAPQPPGPVQQPGPPTGPANGVPSEPPAKQVASADQITRPRAVQSGSHGDHRVQGRISKKPAEGDRIIRSAKATLQSAERDSGQEQRLVSSSAASLRWPSADEPFVNMGGRGR